MARILETTVELKSSPGKFLDMFVGKQQFEISSVCPSYVQGCELREGEMGQVGSIVVWRYVHDGEEKMMMEMIDSIDLENNQITFKVLDGDLMKEYTLFLITLQVTSKEGDVGSVAHWHFQYVKLNEKVADPESLLQFAIEVSKEIDAHLFSW
ncbi:MLP-like protein 34 [Brassica napus]|uniref:MLP-like protein 34 n=1 Tax=Brassica napus TaxID=3708 RepID=UPI0020787935|nr:MLP-like protein 34 [Brassica napus]